MIQRNLIEGLDTLIKRCEGTTKNNLALEKPKYEAYDVALLMAGEDIGKRLEPIIPITRINQSTILREITLFVRHSDPR